MSTKFTTGNAARDLMIMAALVEAMKAGRPVNFPNIGFDLEQGAPDFDLSQEEFDGILANMGGLPVEPEAPPTEEPPPTTEEAADVSEPQPLTLEEARDKLAGLHNALSQARGDVLSLQTKLRTTRDKLAKAIAAFVAGRAPMTREQLQRDHIASEQQRKQRGEKLGMRGAACGPSVIDRVAHFSRGGGINQGHGPGFRRGAYPQSMKGMPNYDPRRGPVAKQG